MLKKHSILFLIFSLIVIMTGCRTSNKQSVETLDFPIRENMTLESTYKSSVENTEVEVSIYEVKNGSLNTFLSEYEKDLNDSGWVTTRDLKPNGLVVEKNSKSVTVLCYEQESKLMVDIIPTPMAEK